jgi:hypothetical protein
MHPYQYELKLLVNDFDQFVDDVLEEFIPIGREIRVSGDCVGIWLHNRVIREVFKRGDKNTLFAQNSEQRGWSRKNMVDQK